jgi:hypothetical protein
MEGLPGIRLLRFKATKIHPEAAMVSAQKEPFRGPLLTQL